MPAKDLAEEIYQTLSKQSFVDWYEKSFLPHIEGEEGYKPTDVIKEEIRELFNVKPETQKRFIVVDQELVSRSFTEIQKGNVVLFNHAFRKVAKVIRNDRHCTFVEFEDGSDAALDGLVFTKG